MTAVIILTISLLLLLLQSILDGRSSFIFNPKNLFQIYLIIQIPVVLLLSTEFDLQGSIRLSSETSQEEILGIGFVFLLGQLCLMLGWYSTPLRSHFRRAPSGTTFHNAQRASVVIYLLFGLGYLAFFALLQVNGGYSAFIESREEWRAGGMAGQGILILPCTAGITLGASILVIQYPSLFTGRTGVYRMVALAIATIAPASQLGFRGMMLIPLVQLLFLYHLKVQRLNAKKALPYLGALALAFTLYGLYRETSFIASDDVNWDAISQLVADRPELAFGVLLRSRGADVIAVIIEDIKYPTQHLLFWPSLYESLTIAIPSGVFTAKPKPLSVEFSEIFFGLNGGVSPTAIGEAYWHGGIIGVSLIFTLFGAVFRLFQWIVDKHSDSPTVVLLCVINFPALFLAAESLQGNLNSIVLNTLFCISIIALLRGRLTHRRPRAVKAIKS
jgi:hypothetical protein